MTAKQGIKPPLPLPPGFRSGQMKGISSKILDKHENLVVNTIRNNQQVADVVAIRLRRIVEEGKAKWKPDRDFMELLKISAEVCTKLSAEYRQLQKVRNAGELSDEELRLMLKPLIFAALDAMTTAEFGDLLDEYDKHCKEKGTLLRQLEDGLTEAEIVE